MPVDRLSTWQRAQNELGLVFSRGAASDGLAAKNMTAAEDQFALAADDDAHAAANLAKVRIMQGRRGEAFRLFGEARHMGNRRAEQFLLDMMNEAKSGARPTGRKQRSSLEARESLISRTYGYKIEL